MSDEDLVVRGDDLDWTDHEPAEGYSYRSKQLGAAVGGEGLGATLYAIDPGQSTAHRHWHTGNEEALYVLSGDGTLELGPEAEEVTIDAGTYVAFPTDERGTHAITAGDDGLEILLVSEMNDPDVIVYPDEEMVGLYAGDPPGGDAEQRTLYKFLDTSDERDYWE